MPSGDDLETYYRHHYRIEIGKGRRPAKGRLWRIAALAVERTLDILSRAPESVVTVDAGCGAGELVYMLGTAGCDSFGFDPDSSYISWARSVIGPRMKQQTFQDVAIAPSSVDLVTLYHVLEHLHDPHAALARCAGWLKEGGLLVVEVPNFEATVQGPAHQYLKGHLYYFNLQSLHAVVSQNGLRLDNGGVFNAGENLRCYFRKDQSANAVNTAMRENAKRILSILQTHTRRQYYTSGVPYNRLWNKINRTINEAIYTLRMTDFDILDFHARNLQQGLQGTVRSSAHTPRMDAE